MILITGKWQWRYRRRYCALVSAAVILPATANLGICWKMVELLPFNWFQNGGRRRLGFLAYVNFDGNSGCGTQLAASVSNLVQIYAIMPTYGQKCDFQYCGRRHLWFCEISILPVKPVTRPRFMSLSQIWWESIQKWPSYGRLTDFKMVAAAILDFWPMSILMVNLAPGPHFLSACVSNLVQIYAKMAEIWPKVWFSIRRPPILWDVNFAGKTSYGTS